MKKLLGVAALVLTVGIGSLVVNADSPMAPNIMPAQRNTNFTLEERNDWHNERHSYRKDELKKALENGQINQEEYKKWQEHFDYMEEFHNKNIDNENNFMGRGFGGCGSSGHRSRGGMGMKRGYRR